VEDAGYIASIVGAGAEGNARKDTYLFCSPSGEAMFSDRACWEFRRGGRVVIYWCGAPCVIRNGISRRAPNKAMYWPPVHLNP
jgi:hypothetical protein